MSGPLQFFVGEFLTFLEQREERLLTWGFYRIQWTAQEAVDAFDTEAPPDLQALWEPLAAGGRTLRGLLQEMERRHFIYLVPESIDAYRTRFAEGVRLLANLRQMFKESDWATGPRLVSDIKLRVTPRQYPRRDHTADAVWERLRPRCPAAHVGLMERCFRALATRGGEALRFAGFQVRAFEHILERYGAAGFTGSVVSAGTGSGKTKAFYLPAFLRIAPELASAPFTKVIAVYPRNVLLADQLREAITEAEKLRPVLEAAGLRPIRFGALLGDTPYRHYFEAPAPKSYHWERRGDGAVIPFLKSPVDGGRSDLLWRDADRLAKRTALYRAGESAPDVPDGVLALTREELQSAPPDVLFLSLEMLNREMTNPQWQAAFGLRQGLQRGPRLLLLDEVHAHQGLAGAQVAWILRRWRHWSQVRTLHVTGLSATLRDAPVHLAHLAGLSPAQVQEFRPRPGVDAAGEMEAEGAEYHLALKGDPASGSPLLAASIQAGMLLARLMTPLRQAASPAGAPLKPEAFFRRKVFGFSDNLDSVNRWFSDMTDAENKRLAALRATPADAVPAAVRIRRMQEGQVWELPELLGHDLRRPLTVTRCSSQDRGADANSDLIIATSSLEVGFDDPEVGAVLHHKRPGSMSSFIQRKGRAGRTRGARPWTVTVLSDYGADRWAFHSAERLFQPEVESLHLPILNPFVLRVQLASFLIDWIGTRLGGSESAFRILQGPATFPPAVRAQERTRDLLRGLLEGGQTWREFEDELTRFFRRGSGLPEETARQHLDSLLWHEPRPLLLRVIPTVLRKLEAAWRYTYPPAGATSEDAAARRPLPQFIPRATFSELEIGEATLEFEPYRNRAREPETLSVSQLLFETCPGRVSKRFATVPSEPGYWHPFSSRLVAGANVAAVAALFPRHTFLEAVAGVSIVQPEAAAVVHRPAKISDGSNGTWQWQTLVRPLGAGTALPVRDAPPWREVFSEARAFLHSNAEWLEVLRYAGEGQFELRRDRESVPGTIALQSATPDGSIRDEAIGFRMSVDGVRFVLHAGHLASRPAVPESMLARFRPDWFAHRLAHAPGLRGLVNSFQAEWLAQLSLAMLTATALRHHGSLPAAQEALAGRRSEAARKVLDVIFQMRGANPAGADEEARLRKTLLELWETAAVQTEILQLEQSLWAEPDAEMMAWVRQRYAATLAQALRAAMIAMAPQVSEDDLAVDVLAREDAGWDLLVTELSPGGLGQVETIVREMQRQPRRFLDALEHALEFCPREQTAGDVLAVAARACAGGDLAAAFEQTRSAVGFSEMETARETLEATLQSGGFAAGRGLMVALMNKLLRPASSPESDQLIFRLNRGWRRRSARLQVAIPLRTFAYACAQHQRVGDFVQRTLQRVGGEAPTAPQLYAQLQQLLLEGCADSCPECLGQRGRYYELGSPSRALAVAWLDLEIETLTLDSGPGDWAELAREILRRRGRVRLVAKPAQHAILVGALPALVVTELELAELRVPVAVGRIERRGDRLAVVLHVPDFIHG